MVLTSGTATYEPNGTPVDITDFGIENVVGTGYDDTLIGSSDANSLSGGAGDDLLVGGSGSDALSGGEGVDGVSFRGEGFVSIDLYRGEALNEAGALDALSDLEIFFGSEAGNAFVDTQFGGDSALIGGAADDTFVASQEFQADEDIGPQVAITGYDLMDGGEGFDTVLGGALELYFREHDGSVVGAMGVNLAPSGYDDDQVVTASDVFIDMERFEGFYELNLASLETPYVLSSDATTLEVDGKTIELEGIQSVVLSNLGGTFEAGDPIKSVWGGQGSDTITGTDQDIPGGAGDDILTSTEGGELQGGSGNDTLTSMGGGVISAGAGQDTIVTGVGSSVFGDAQDTLTMAGIDVTGNGRVFAFDSPSSEFYDLDWGILAGPRSSRSASTARSRASCGRATSSPTRPPTPCAIRSRARSTRAGRSGRSPSASGTSGCRRRPWSRAPR